MSDFKPGDRVRVEFEGRVFGSGVHWTYMKHALTGQVITVKTDDCTLIEPEIVLPEIPGTIVQVDPLNEHDELVAYEYDSQTCAWWYRVGSRGSCTTDEVVGMCREYGYRVIPAATPDEVLR